MIRKLLKPFTRYPMHLNVAGKIHRMISHDMLDIKLYDLSRKWDVDSPASRLNCFGRQLRKTVFYAPVTTASICAPVFNKIDYFFGNTLSDPIDGGFSDRCARGRFGPGLVWCYLSQPHLYGAVLVCRAVSALLSFMVVLSYLPKGLSAALLMGFLTFIMPSDFILTQVSSLTGACFKMSLLVVGSCIGAMLGPFLGIYAAYNWKAGEQGYNTDNTYLKNELTDDIINPTDFACLMPISEIPKNLLFVTKDKFAFNVCDFVTFNVGKMTVTNPYTRLPLNEDECKRVYRHPSGEGRRLISPLVENVDTSWLYMSREAIESIPDRSLFDVLRFA